MNGKKDPEIQEYKYEITEESHIQTLPDESKDATEDAMLGFSATCTKKKKAYHMCK